MNKIYPHPVVIVLTVLAFPFAFWPDYPVRSAHADPKPGLWQEGTFTVNGESIQKFRDTTHGSNTACYLIRRTSGGQGPANPQQEVVTLSCVSEKP